MDVITLDFCTFALCFVLTISWIAVQRTNVSDEPLCNWTLVSICFVCYSAVSVAGNLYFSNITATLLSNLFLVAAHGFILNGLSAHIYVKKQYLIGIVCIGLVAFVHILFPRNAPLSLAFTFASIMLLDALALVALCQGLQRKQKTSYTAVIIALGCSLFHAASVLFFVYHLAPLEQIPSPWVELYMPLADLFTIPALLLSLFFMYIWQREFILNTISRTDSLTQWLNGVALADYAQREFARCQRSTTSFAFITFDIDHFEHVYDRIGHLAGDKALKHVANVAKEATREYDYHFRIGGETFIVMVTGLKIGDFKGIAERIRSTVNETPFYYSTDAITLSVSVGIATLEQGDMNWQAILERADEALYSAKISGRNKTKLLTTHGLTLVKNE